MLNLEGAERARQEFTRRHPSGKDDSTVPKYYEKIVQQFNLASSRKSKKIGFIVVAHFVHSLPYFLEALASLGDVVAIISKQSRVVKSVRDSISSIYKEIIAFDVNKMNLADSVEVTKSFFTRLFESEHLREHQFVILDHGGYFAPQLNHVIPKFRTRILGIVEHTWNGEVRYQQQLTQRGSPVPIRSVAHSKLKGLETQDVASSIIDAISTSMGGVGLNQSLRSLSNILILGYGHIGEEVAKGLKKRFHALDKKKIYICDLSDEAIARAKTHFASDHCTTRKTDFLSQADLIITATSSTVLTKTDFAILKPGAVVACATSSDDQFSADALEAYDIMTPDEVKSSQPCVEYRSRVSPTQIFYLLANGDSINFAVGSTSHPIIHTIFSSILLNANKLISATPDSPWLSDKIHQSDKNDDAQVKVIFEKFFGELVDEPMAKLYEEGWSLPADNSAKFVGRIIKLEEIHQHLSKTSSVALTQKHALTGLGGVGKTELAIRYIHQFRTQYKLVLWFNAETHLTEQFLTLAEKLQIRTRTSHRSDAAYVSPQTQSYEIESQRPLAEIVRAIYKKLRLISGTCLIVFDNADNSEKLKIYLPPDDIKSQSAAVKILITSRERSYGWGDEIDVGMFTSQEARDYIKQHLPNTTDAVCDKFAKKLGFLPLAIVKAVSYIKKTRTVNTVENYLDKFKERRALLLKDKSLNGGEANNRASVLTTWNLSLESLREASPAATKIIEFCAYLDPTDIPMALFSDLAEKIGEDNDEAISVLDQFSLIELSPKTATFSIHRLLQEVIQINQCDDHNIFKWIQLLEKIKQHSETAIISTIVEYVSAHFNLDHDDEKSIAACTSLVNHVQKLLKHCKAYEICTTKTGKLYKTLGKYFLYIRRDGKTGEKYLLDAVTQLSPDKTQSVEVYSLLGFSMLLQGNLHQALQYCERSLTEDNGVEPDSTRADRCWIMGHITFNIGDYDKAFEFFTRAQEILDDLDPPQKLYGRRRMTISHSLGELFATQYFKKFNLSQAKAHYRAAQATYTRFFKVSSYEQFTLLTSLGRLYLSKGRYAKARSYIDDAEKMAAILFGSAEHEETIKLFLLRGSLLENQDELSQASSAYHKARKLAKQLEHHPLEVASLIRLTEVSSELSDKRKLLQQALEILSPHGNTEVATILRLYQFLLEVREGKASTKNTEDYLDNLKFDNFLPSLLIFAAELVLKISSAWLQRGNALLAMKLFTLAYSILKRQVGINILTEPTAETSLWRTQETKCYSFATPLCHGSVIHLVLANRSFHHLFPPRENFQAAELEMPAMILARLENILRQLSSSRMLDQEISILDSPGWDVRSYFAEDQERTNRFLYCGYTGVGKSSYAKFISLVESLCQSNTLCIVKSAGNYGKSSLAKLGSGFEILVMTNPKESLQIPALHFAGVDQHLLQFDLFVTQKLQAMVAAFESSSTTRDTREAIQRTYQNKWEILKKFTAMPIFDKDTMITIIFDRFKIIISSYAKDQNIYLQTRIAKFLPQKHDFFIKLGETLLKATALARRISGGVVEFEVTTNSLDMRWAFHLSNKDDDKRFFTLLLAFISLSHTLRTKCVSYTKSFEPSDLPDLSLGKASQVLFSHQRKNSLAKMNIANMRDVQENQDEDSETARPKFISKY